MLFRLNSQANNNASISPSGSIFETLPLEYQSIVIESEHEEKLVLKLIFSFLIFMIISVIIVFQKKSLFHLFFYDKNKK